MYHWNSNEVQSVQGLCQLFGGLYVTNLTLKNQATKYLEFCKHGYSPKQIALNIVGGIDKKNAIKIALKCLAHKVHFSVSLQVLKQSVGFEDIEGKKKILLSLNQIKFWRYESLQIERFKKYLFTKESWDKCCDFCPISQCANKKTVSICCSQGERGCLKCVNSLTEENYCSICTKKLIDKKNEVLSFGEL